MSEASVVKAVRRRHGVVTWFGSCSYRKLKVAYAVRKMLCPFCGRELEDGDYSGCKVFAKDKHASYYFRDSWLPMFEDGVKVWHVLPKRRFCSVETVRDADLLSKGYCVKASCGCRFCRIFFLRFFSILGQIFWFLHLLVLGYCIILLFALGFLFCLRLFRLICRLFLLPNVIYYCVFRGQHGGFC